ncbi:STAS domain-containing protein [Longispora sp. NPDC051575]|uniref:STAS domain-containing protein n=1 Tax=Longispora sp. NPDC051575 TaxID=3154943 RepID=UPI0034275B8C
MSSTDSLDVQVTTQKAGPVVAVSGALRRPTAAELRTVLRTLIDAGHDDITVDATALRDCDLVGLGVLVNAAVLLRDRQAQLCLLTAPGLLVDLLEQTSLTGLFAPGPTARDTGDGSEEPLP